ncbi:alpha-acetolactate decarboxylase [Thelonectria olida]|uniref:Alpha-acetolactate decarboxylase n=1 Tax=Thelonectria olida TaxID=1576542 RepID=A0A9P8VY16_9HYPO|nr:alpha-acetolactate decarboxylase [Thelonectria olida]
MATNEIYQYSIMSGLIDGVANDGLPIQTLLTHGDHGLGTFRHMVGEMIVIDGHVFQMKSDGSIVPIDLNTCTDITPFAMITRFQPTQHTKAVIPSKKDFTRILGELTPKARNLFVAFRIDGMFKSVTVRTADGQRFPGERVIELGKRQVTHVLEEVRGSLIGFRSPGYTQGVSVAGDHLHFINTERTLGGHVLGFETEEEVHIGIAVISKVHLELPTDNSQFNEAALELDASSIHKVEG